MMGDRLGKVTARLHGQTGTWGFGMRVVLLASKDLGKKTHKKRWTSAITLKT